MKAATRTAAHIVYRCYDADERLIYVGMTSLPLSRRFKAHEIKNPAVVADAARVVVTDYPDRAAAAEAESRAIDAENPAYNIRRGAAYEPSADELRSAAMAIPGAS